MRLGPVLFAVATTIFFAGAAPAETLKIATWNIEHLRDGINEGNNPRSQADFDRLRDYATRLDADVVAFQEVENEVAAERVFDPNEYVVFIEDRNNTQRTGFAVRRTLVVTQNADFDDLNVTGGLRHGVDITVNVGDRQVRLMSVHLKSGCFDRPLTHGSDACRKLNRQVPHVEAWIDARAGNGVPLVVMGDWNRRFDATGDQFWPEIDDGDPTFADLDRPTEGRTSDCWGGQFPLYIDHIVLGKQTTEWMVDSSFEQLVYDEDISEQEQLSDHCAIAVTLNVPTNAPDDLKAQLLQRIGAVEDELEELRALVEGLP